MEEKRLNKRYIIFDGYNILFDFFLLKNGDMEKIEKGEVAPNELDEEDRFQKAREEMIKTVLENRKIKEEFPDCISMIVFTSDIEIEKKTNRKEKHRDNMFLKIVYTREGEPAEAFMERYSCPGDIIVSCDPNFREEMKSQGRIVKFPEFFNLKER